MSEMNKYDFFLCYTRNDYAVVRLFQIELEKHGANYFDFDSLVPRDFADQITTAIRNSRAMLVFCSANADNSRWVHNEYRYALSLNIPVVPIWIEGEEFISGILAYDLACLQGYDYTSLPLQDIITRLCRDFLHPEIGTKPKVSYTSNKETSVLSKKKIIVGCLLCFVTLVVGIVSVLSFHYFKNLQIIKAVVAKPNRVAAPVACYSVLHIYIIIFVALLVLLLIVIIIIRYRKNKSLSIRFYNKKKNGTVDVYVDSVCQTTINAGETKSVTNKKGEYAIRIQSKELEDKYLEFIQPFNKQESKKIVNINLNDQQHIDIKQNKPLKTYRCFIGGSTSIVHERNAARAVLSILYNMWDKYDFKITAHTYEDFAQKHKIGGNQMEYDEFIKQKADCTIFIICKHVGDKTLGEYQLAVDVCEKTENQRPAVFVYNDISCEGDDSVVKFKELVKSNKAYWNDYTDLTQLMLKLQNDLNAELTKLLFM